MKVRMMDEPEKKDDKIEKKDDKIEKKDEVKKLLIENLLKPPIANIIIAVIIIIGLYFIMSPYQNCLRDNQPTSRCVKYTSW